MRSLLAAALLTAVSCAPASAQSSGRTLAERLGYPPDAKLLIVHADDLGMAHSVNAASIKALESGLVNSASIMVPPPWFPEIAAWARQNPNADLGLHLTLTSEWTPFRWGPVLPKDRVPSLLDENGYFHITEDVAAAKIDPREAEAEIRAQIERARAFGIRPTHLDSHMRTLLQNAALFDVYLRVARDHKLPVGIWREIVSRPELAAVLKPEDIVLDWLETIGPEVPAEGWSAYYTNVIRNLKPGVTELVVHTAYDDAEMRAATLDHPDWGAAWRQRDFDVLTSDAFRSLLRANGVKLITWREIAKTTSSPAVLFDDFSYKSHEQLAKNGWIIRTELGWPGVPGASWGPAGVSYVDGTVRMTAATDGTPANTRQVQLCHERKYGPGTYGARVRWTDQPVSGPDGDQVVETFYLISPLREPMAEEYSEIDFEYLPNGGWGRPGPILFATTWETFSPEPNWKSDNVHESKNASYAGWRTLVVQVADGKVRYFVDGAPFAEHSGKVYPESLMSFNFNLWFTRNGLQAAGAQRTYEEDIDWAFYEAGAVLTPAEVEARVAELRKRKIAFRDTVPRANPPLTSPCNF